MELKWKKSTLMKTMIYAAIVLIGKETQDQMTTKAGLSQFQRRTFQQMNLVLFTHKQPRRLVK